MASLDIPFIDVERIYPSENDIAFSDYNGVNGTEVNYSKNLHWRRPRNAVLANLDGSGNPTALAGFVCSNGGFAIVNITRGRAYIEGRYVELNAGASYAVTVDTDKDTYIYLQLNIAGSVQVSPPARFITVPVAHDAVHSRVPNAVLIAKIITNATPIITTILDLRPSQISLPILLGDITAQGQANVPGLDVPIPLLYQGTVHFGDILFNSSLCIWFDVTGYPVGSNIEIEVRAYGDDSDYYVNTFITNVYAQSLATRHMAFGYVNVFNSGVGVKIPIGNGGHNVYHIFAQLVGTIPFGAGLNGHIKGMSFLKEWASVS